MLIGSNENTVCRRAAKPAVERSEKLSLSSHQSRPAIALRRRLSLHIVSDKQRGIATPAQSDQEGEVWSSAREASDPAREGAGPCEREMGRCERDVGGCETDEGGCE